MKIGAILGGVFGIALAAWLLQSYGVDRILDLLARAGWFGMLAVIGFHFVQILFSAAAWRTIAGPMPRRPSLRTYIVLRWIREGVNNLLPSAQIGGEFVVVRLLQCRFVPLAAAIAGTTADLTMEMVTQIGFTLMGLGLMLHSIGDGGIAGYIASGLVIAMMVAGAFLGAQWLGLATAIENGMLRLGRSLGWTGMTEVAGLHDALVACYRVPGRVMFAGLWHTISWLLGGIEVCLALYFLGHNVDISTGLIIESLGQALKAVGFAVPGALGVQEGGLIIVCQLFGLSPEVAIALSLMKRLREVVLGVPGLVAWRYLQAQTPAAPKSPSFGAV